MVMCVNVYGLHHMTVHNYDAFLKWRDDQLSSTGALAQHERWLTGSFCRLAGYTVNSNTGCFEVGPAVVCGIAIFKKKHSKGTNVTCHWDMNDFVKCHKFSIMHAFLLLGAWSD